MRFQADDPLATANDILARTRAAGAAAQKVSDEEVAVKAKPKKGKVAMMKRKEPIAASSSGPVESRRDSTDVVYSVSETPHDQAASSPASRKKSKKMSLFTRKPSVDVRSHHHVRLVGTEDSETTSQEDVKTEPSVKRQVTLPVQCFPPSPLVHSTSHTMHHPEHAHLPVTSELHPAFSKDPQLQSTSHCVLAVHNDRTKHTSGYQASLLTRPAPQRYTRYLFLLLALNGILVHTGKKKNKTKAKKKLFCVWQNNVRFFGFDEVFWSLCAVAKKYLKPHCMSTFSSMTFQHSRNAEACT